MQAGCGWVGSVLIWGFIYKFTLSKEAENCRKRQKISGLGGAP
jgi:hypothetical protein